MNKIELILADSTYAVEQFTNEQIATLNEMIDNKISTEQIAIIAHPSVNELSYSVLFDYLSKGHSITSQEYQKYLNIDAARINDIIVNVYLGKLHGLSEEQINLYARRDVFNIKVARLLVEKSKDASTDQLNQIVNGRFGTKSIVGKQAIQDYLNNDLSLEKLLSLTACNELTQDNYEYIKNADSRVLSIIKGFYTHFNNNTTNLAHNYYVQQSIQIDNNNTCITNNIYIGREILNKTIHFDSLDTYNKFYTMYKIIADSDSNYQKYLPNLFKFYNYNFISNNPFIKLVDMKDTGIYYLYSDGIKINAAIYNILYCYYDTNTQNRFINWKNDTTYRNEFEDLDDYLTTFINTHGFKDYIEAKWINKLTENGMNIIKKGLNLLDYLFDLYKTEKDKETEIPYLKEHLENVTDKYISEIICMKENKCTNDEIHLFIEKYLSNYKFTPTVYFDKENEYQKDWSISEFLAFENSQIDLDDLSRLKKLTSEEIKYIVENNLKLDDNSPIQKDLIKLCMENKWTYEYITWSNSETEEILNNYKFVKTHFKNKPKCIEYLTFNDKKVLYIVNHLLKNISNFDDKTMYEIMAESPSFINFALKLSPIITDLQKLRSIYRKIHNNSSEDKIKDFNMQDEKITADVIVKFCKKENITVPQEIAELLPANMDSVIEKSVDYFGSSKNFKPIKYDDETIYVDIIGNKALKGSHIITFNKENEEYEYIFEIVHEDDTLNYSAKITTKKDVIDAINKSIALIENIDEYKEYASELQEMLKTI